MVASTCSRAARRVFALAGALLIALALAPAIAAAVDNDRDGYEPPADCNDASSDIHPGAVEIPANVIDENCDGFLADADNDGFDAPADCDDSEPTVHPGAPEYPRNVIDENCDGLLADADGDGYDAPADCDDSQPTVHPGAREIHGNRIDENCNGTPPWPRVPVGARLKTRSLQNGVTRLQRLTISHVRAGDRVHITCRRGGCRGKIRLHGRATGDSGSLDLSMGIRGARMRNGQRLLVRVRRRGYAASVFVYTMHAGMKPTRVLRCQWPYETTLQRC